MKCSTIGCQHEVGSSVVRWNDGPDEPVCDQCARFYNRIVISANALGQSAEYAVVPV